MIVPRNREPHRHGTYGSLESLHTLPHAVPFLRPFLCTKMAPHPRPTPHPIPVLPDRF